MNRNMHPVIANSTDTRYNDDVVPPKSKRRKLEKDAYDELNCVDTFISPIKATQTNTINEHVQIMHKGRSTAILGRPYYEGLPHLLGSVHENNVVLWRILLDSGSDGDLLFARSNGQKTSVPYFVREATQTWHTSMGIFRTEKQGDLDVVFPEFSNSKRIHIEPDIIDIADDAPEPMFDLIIGTETMKKLDCILDFKNKVIEIDHIQLPMRKLSALNNPNKRLEIYYNSFYVEPDVTKEATERTVRILDAKYEKALFAQTSPHNLVQSYIHTIKHTRFYVGIDLATANKTTNFITIDTLVDRNHPGNPVNDNTLIINCKNNTSTSLVWFQFILSLTISTPQTANPGSFHLISSSISTSRPLGKAKRLYLHQTSKQTKY